MFKIKKSFTQRFSALKERSLKALGVFEQVKSDLEDVNIELYEEIEDIAVQIENLSAVKKQAESTVKSNDKVISNIDKFLSI